MSKLYLSFAPPEKWRTKSQSKWLDGEEWKRLRQKILERDDFTCAYCGYRSEKYQIVDHIDGDPENQGDGNLQIICQMCNLIKHSGQGCELKGIVDIYKESKYSQNEIIRITREMRDSGAKDEAIIKHLGLKELMPFRMDREYLRKLFGFVTARKSRNSDDVYDRWLEYHRKTRNTSSGESPQTKLEI
ncbi:MAG: HNH endonuclease [Candidatus Micrarchaeota archaeon]